MMEERIDIKKPTKIVSAISGGVSGALTRFICQPLDVIKIRFQLQVEPISKHHSNSKYYGIKQAAVLIVKEEGLAALWKGHCPAQMLSVVYGVVQFGAFELLKEEMERIFPGYSNKTISNFVCGSVAGCAATLVSFPFDVVRTRLVAQGSQKIVYNTMRSAFHYIYTKEGPHAFWKGLTPTLIQAAPLAGIQFGFYKFFKSLFVHNSWLGNEAQETLSVSGSLLAGSLAGLTSKSMTYPLDLARKRMQIQGFQTGRTGFGKTINDFTAVYQCQMQLWYPAILLHTKRRQ